MRNSVPDHSLVNAAAAVAVPVRTRAVAVMVIATPVVVCPFIVPVHRLAP